MMDIEDEATSAEANARETVEKRFPVRVWFIPLEDPLNLPQGYVARFPRARSPLGPAWFDKDRHDHHRRVETMISLKIWQLETGLAMITERSDLAFKACRRAFPMYLGDEQNNHSEFTTNLPEPSLPATVVEVSITIVRDNVPDEAYASTLDEAVHEIQCLQRAHGYVTGRPVRPLNLQALPPYVPIATASFGESGLLTDGAVSVYAFPTNISQLPSRRDFDELEMQAFASFVWRSNGAFGGFLASHSEARAALQHRSDARSSLLASATACEVFLDDFLKHLLWESRKTPEECLSVFVEASAITTVLSRTRRELGTLVGGNWNDKTQPDLCAWQVDVAHVRHRTIHGGYRPTPTEARQAIEASDRLRDYAVEVLVRNLRKYPRTALMMIGSQGLDARGKLTNVVRRELNSNDVPDWQERFIRWRECLAGLVQRQVEPFTPDQSYAQLVGVSDGQGGVRFVRHHRESALAANANLHATSPTIDRIKADAALRPIGAKPISYAVRTDVPTTLTEDWVSQHRRIPLCGVMADGADFY